jgi:hypothetical protein
MSRKKDDGIKRVSFEEAFPSIEDVTIEIKQGIARGGWVKYSHLGVTEIGDFIPCDEASCSGGGLRLGDVLHRMIRDREEYVDAFVQCGGHYRSRASCQNAFQYKVRIKFRAP